MGNAKELEKIENSELGLWNHYKINNYNYGNIKFEQIWDYLPFNFSSHCISFCDSVWPTCINSGYDVVRMLCVIAFCFGKTQV